MVISRRTLRTTRPTLATALTATFLLGVSACSNSPSAATDGGGTTPPTGLESARATVATFQANQPAITIPALPSKPPKGLRLDVIGCPLPVCQITVKGATDAANVLGWEVKSITEQLTPESYISSFNQALTDKPDLLTYIGVFPNSMIQSQLQTAKDMGIKVVGLVPSDEPSALMPAAYTGSSTFVAAGKLLANIAVADAGQPVGTLFVRDPNYDGAFGKEWNSYKSTLTQLCPGCTNTDLEIAVANIGRTVPGQIVSALQQHPDIRYVVVPYDDLLTGVYVALQSAGLADKVKLIGQSPNKQSLAAIRNGQQFASVGTENGVGGWRAVDGLARQYMGIPLGDCCTAPAGWSQIFTKSNAPAEGDLSALGTPKVPGIPDSFLAAWHAN